MEDNGAPNSWVFAKECLQSVLRLYDQALSLPGTHSEMWLDESITHEDWKEIMMRIGRRLGGDYYWHVEPVEPREADPPQPTLGSLSDDLADIWRELKEGLLALESDPSVDINDVVWHWRYSFEIHWARHAAGAIGALNTLCYGEFADPTRPASTRHDPGFCSIDPIDEES